MPATRIRCNHCGYSHLPKKIFRGPRTGKTTQKGGGLVEEKFICAPCVIRLARQIKPSETTVGRWDVDFIRASVAEAGSRIDS